MYCRVAQAVGPAPGREIVVVSLCSRRRAWVYAPRMRFPASPILLALMLSACGGGGGGQFVDARDIDATPIDAEVDAPPLEIPVFRNPVGLADLPLARMAVERLGVGPRQSCDQCHGLTPERFAGWLESTRIADTCLTNLRPSTPAEAQAILECFRPAAGENYNPHRLGIYTTGASLAWFRAVIQLAYQPNWGPQYAAWTSQMVMPRNTPGLYTQDEFDVVAEWFARGMPQLNTVLTEPPPTGGCTGNIEPEVATHVAAMQTEGWRALNRDDGLNMHGCQGAAAPRDCLATYPEASANAWSTGWDSAAPTTKLRILYQYNFSSAFWTRGSADGRFVAHGGGPGGSGFIDLQRNVRIPATAQYDPGFFPDNSGFVMQGASKPWCRQSVLTANPPPTQITFNEPTCTAVPVVGLYQHVGAVRGGDYWAVAGQFVSDNGGGEPGAQFSAGSVNELTPMVWNGTAYVAKPQIDVPTPNEGDTIISPSAKLLLSRVAGAGGQNGFAVRKLNATANGNTYNVTTPLVARYCVRGGKPAFSYDDRWVVYHHWVEAADFASFGYAAATDPAFVAMRQAGTSNIYLLDTLTGLSTRITTMQNGQRALFPYFRSDGWIYFIVKRAPAAGSEVVVASDAALVFEN